MAVSTVRSNCAGQESIARPVKGGRCSRCKKDDSRVYSTSRELPKSPAAQDECLGSRMKPVMKWGNVPVKPSRNHY